MDIVEQSEKPLTAGLVEQAVHAAQLPVILADARAPHDPIVYANPAFLALTGYRSEEVVGRNCRFLQGPETDPAAIDQIREALRAGRPATVEILNYRKDGARFWNALHVSPVRNGAGQVTHFLGSQRDVTARKLADLELARRNEELGRAMAEALKQKSVLLQEIDHRVKNNLQLISSLMLLQSRRADPQAAAALRRMLERVTAVAAVHRRLFQGERLDRFELAPFVRDLVEDLARAARPAPRIVFQLDEVVVGSSQAAPLALVVSELVTNALRHAHAEEVRIALARRDDGFEICVADNGTGIAGAPGAFGLTIVQLLAQQLRGHLVLEDAGPGLRARLVCPQPAQAV